MMTSPHRTFVRVYYEDTDFSGRVYHASYLRFLERGRTEWLRDQGFEHGRLAGAPGLVFAVRSLRVDFLAPALMDDGLTVQTRVGGGRCALIPFEQTILRGATVLVEAEVRVVTLKNNRATRPPRDLLDRIGAINPRSGDDPGRRAR